MTIEQLKARAYDLLAMMEKAQMELREINNKISNYKEPENAESI